MGGALFEEPSDEFCATAKRVEKILVGGQLRAYFLGTFLYAKKVPARRVGGIYFNHFLPLKVVVPGQSQK